jgi:uncharacterized protein (UPF0248 family)
MNEISEKTKEKMDEMNLIMIEKRILKITDEITTHEIQILKNEMTNEMKNETNDHKVEMDDEIDENNEKVVSLNQKKRNQNLKLLLKTKTNIYHRILKSEKQWENNQDSLKSIQHFYDITLNEKNHILTEKQIFGLKEKHFLN